MQQDKRLAIAMDLLVKVQSVDRGKAGVCNLQEFLQERGR
jgi:hypothetical protein